MSIFTRILQILSVIFLADLLVTSIANRDYMFTVIVVFVGAAVTSAIPTTRSSKK